MSETPAEPMPQDQSILASIKKVLNQDDSYTEFDTDMVFFINSVFPTLNQLGIGLVDGFSIDGREVSWTEYLGNNKNLNDVKLYIAMRVRMMFDPPELGHHVTAMKEQIKELEWRINANREEQVRLVTDPLAQYGGVIVLDGGTG